MKKNRGQSIIEYILLVAIAIIALLASNFFLKSGSLRRSLDSHFDTVQKSIQRAY